jgi:hypothetical protein
LEFQKLIIDRSLKIDIVKSLFLLCFGLLVGCRQDMHDQPKYEPLETSSTFSDGRASRPLIEGTIARGHLNEDVALYTGKNGKDFVPKIPFELTKQVIDRGQERYNIFCTPCHDLVGNGLGMVVRRGFKKPPSLHITRLQEAPDGYFFDVITNGFGAMSSYAEQVPVRDRWAIVAYIRALQLSQHSTLQDVPAPQRQDLEQELKQQ